MRIFVVGNINAGKVILFPNLLKNIHCIKLYPLMNSEKNIQIAELKRS